MKNDEALDGQNKQFQQHITLLCKKAATWFVQHRGRYYLATRVSAPLTQANVRRICIQRFNQEFPEVELTSPLMATVFNRLISEAHGDVTQAIPIWDGSTRCEPSLDAAIIWDRPLDMISIGQAAFIYRCPASQILRFLEAGDLPSSCVEAPGLRMDALHVSC